MSPEELKTLKVLAAQGNADAQLNLGNAYYKGRGGAGVGAAMKWWRKAADQGNVEAQLKLGSACYDAVNRYFAAGTPFWSEEVEAVKWWRKAANQGNAEAQLKLGNACYTVFYVYESWYSSSRVGFWEFWGMTEDEVEPARWWRKAADQGNAEAQFELGKAYYRGDVGVAKDDVEAMKWYRKAADQGFAKALLELGYLYYLGLAGVAKDDVEAYAYFHLACENQVGPQIVYDAQRFFASMTYGMLSEVRSRGEQRTKELRKEIEAKIAAKKAGK
jgi:TPR repeat protein